MSLSVTPLPWDTEQFGLRVGRIDGEGADPAALEAALRAAADDGRELVYWLAPEGAAVPTPLLDAFGGRRIVGHRRYGRDLAEPTPDLDTTGIASILGAPVDAPVSALAHLAGHLSRFKLDDRLPATVFTTLYDAWIEGSLAGRVATEVLAARDDAGATVGLVTLSVRDGVGTIGLIATAPEAQGRGLGKRLMRAAEQAMRDGGATRSEVATQAENRRACRLYEGLGYATVQTGDHYHFRLGS